jgi:hypothetical protein
MHSGREKSNVVRHIRPQLAKFDKHREMPQHPSETLPIVLKRTGRKEKLIP